MFGLAALPYEVTANIVSRISFDDVFNLAATCRALLFLLREERICKSIVQVHALRLHYICHLKVVRPCMFQLLTITL